MKKTLLFKALLGIWGALSFQCVSAETTFTNIEESEKEYIVDLRTHDELQLSEDLSGYQCKQLSAKAESFYLSSLQSNSTLGRFTTALGLSADSPIPAGFDLHSSRCAHGDHSVDKRNDASSVCPIANTPNTSVRYTEDPHTLR